jgi:hypothetical protein
MAEAGDNIRINRVPVLTLWAAVVAERLGFDRDTALTLGQAVAGLSAYAKGVSLGIVEPRPELVREQGDRLRRRAATGRLAGPCGSGGADAGGLAGGEQGQARQPGADRETPRRQVRRSARRRHAGDGRIGHGL